jgi:hypothetical protein
MRQGYGRAARPVSSAYAVRLAAVSLEWTVEEATELFVEQALDLLDGCDDDDDVRPALVWEAVCRSWAPSLPAFPLGDVTAGELRRKLRGVRAELAEGARIP